MHRNAAKLTSGGRPSSWLGVNFWSRTGGPLMWRNYDPEVIRAELRVLREHGLSMTRSFFYWPDFMPEPYRIDEEMTARFGDFLDRHAEAGLATVPTFLVGHMSGENWDPAWRAGRELYSDIWMVAREAWFAAEMVRRFAGHEAVCGWLVSNEMPIYGGAAPRETIAAWAQIILSAVRAAGGTQPASLGDGAWGIEVSGRDNGFSVADSARQCDFIGPHVYPVGDDLSPPALRRGLGLRAGRDLRHASDPGGVRGQLGLRVRHQRGPLLPAGAAQFAAGRRDRLDRLEQHRLRRPGRPGSLPAPRVRDALRPDRCAGHGQAAVGRDGGIRRDPGPGGYRGLPAVRQRRGPGHPVVPGHRLPVHPRGGPHLPRGCVAAGVRLAPGWPTCPPPSPGRAPGSATTPGSTWCPRPSNCSAPPGISWRRGPRPAPSFTSPTRRVPTACTRAPGTRG